MDDDQSDRVLGSDGNEFVDLEDEPEELGDEYGDEDEKKGGGEQK